VGSLGTGQGHPGGLGKHPSIMNLIINEFTSRLQGAADKHDMNMFYDDLMTAYEPRSSGSAPARSKDGSTVLSDRGEILKRWA